MSIWCSANTSIQPMFVLLGVFTYRTTKNWQMHSSEKTFDAIFSELSKNGGMSIQQINPHVFPSINNDAIQ